MSASDWVGHVSNRYQMSEGRTKFGHTSVAAASGLLSTAKTGVEIAGANAGDVLLADGGAVRGV